MVNADLYSAELMVYFEKHHFLEIIRVLLVRMGLDRPLCVKHYLRRNLHKIANRVLAKNTIVNIPSQIDVSRFAISFSKQFNVPIIAYNTRGRKIGPEKFKEILRKFQKFCRTNGLYKKNKIYLNFPKEFDKAIRLQNSQSPPTNFINITNGEPVGPDVKEVLKYYGNTVKEVQSKCTGASNDVEDLVVPEVMYKVKHSLMSKPYDIGAHFVNRVVVMGRRGSGKKTQAKLLADRYNSSYVNVDSLMQHALHAKDDTEKLQSNAFQKEVQFSSSEIMFHLWKRLLEHDTLSRGWVVVGFPNTLKELECFMEEFETPPNGIVIIHCSKGTAMRRVIKEWEKSPCQVESEANTCTFVENEFARYDDNMIEMNKYLKEKTNTVHVNGTNGVCYLKNKMFALLERRMQ